MRGWFEPYFGEFGAVIAQFTAWTAIVLAVLLLLVWVLRRYSGLGLGSMSRGRVPRLAIVDAMALDKRRRLVLIRRDNIEHLILIGGPTDTVIEPTIQRPHARRGSQPTARGGETRTGAPAPADPPAGDISAPPTRPVPPTPVVRTPPPPLIPAPQQPPAQPSLAEPEGAPVATPRDEQPVQADAPVAMPQDEPVQANAPVAIPQDEPPVQADAPVAIPQDEPPLQADADPTPTAPTASGGSNNDGQQSGPPEPAVATPPPNNAQPLPGAGTRAVGGVEAEPHDPAPQPIPEPAGEAAPVGPNPAMESDDPSDATDTGEQVGELEREMARLLGESDRKNPS